MWCPQMLLGTMSPLPQTSSKINALRILVGGPAWRLAAQASRQWTPTAPHWPAPSQGVGKGHSHVPGGRVGGQGQLREGPRTILGLADTARAGMPVAPAGTSSLGHSVGPGGAARLQDSPGEPGNSQRDEDQLRGGLGRPPPPGQQLLALGTQTGQVELEVCVCVCECVGGGEVCGQAG